MDSFVQGSPLHGLCLLVSLLASLGLGILARHFRKQEPCLARIRHFLIVGSIASWLMTQIAPWIQGQFSWSESLPLHFCNLANLLGAYALATRHRLSQALMYFWTLSLCLWAFLTPSLHTGPATLGFWVFWIYHLFIPLDTVWILVADGFRPRWRDWRQAVLVTWLFAGVLALVDAFTGWNYGFVGPSTPSQRTLLDFLGPYPLRLLWMGLIGSALFALCVLPWWRRPKS